MAASKKLATWVWALIVALVLALVIGVVWVLVAGVAMATGNDEIDTWAEGLGQLGIVGEGMDAAMRFWAFLRGKVGGES